MFAQITPKGRPAETEVKHLFSSKLLPSAWSMSKQIMQLIKFSI